MDYIFRRLALEFLPAETRSALGIYSAAQRARQLQTGSYDLPAEDTAQPRELPEPAVSVQPAPGVVHFVDGAHQLIAPRVGAPPLEAAGHPPVSGTPLPGCVRQRARRPMTSGGRLMG
jgi:ribonucleoside-diphosphate reductase alpha chain